LRVVFGCLFTFRAGPRIATVASVCKRFRIGNVFGNGYGGQENTLVCIFGSRRPRVSAYDVHEWINAQLRLLEEQICLIQIDGPRK
jgi:hypothetical protein